MKEDDGLAGQQQRDCGGRGAGGKRRGTVGVFLCRSPLPQQASVPDANRQKSPWSSWSSHPGSATAAAPYGGAPGYRSARSRFFSWELWGGVKL